jgi:hypothetical protein
MLLTTSVTNVVKKTTLLLLGCFGGWNCTYRFSNLYLQPPKGIQTLYVESIFDSSREVTPHEILWEKIQKAFALNGKLILTSKEEADAYLRAHITSAVVNQFDLEGSVSKEIAIPLTDSTGRYQPLSAYENLLAATRFSKKENLSLSVMVEIWDLRTKEKLWSQTYASTDFHKIYGVYTAKESAYLYAEEGFEFLFATLSERIADSILRDFLSLVNTPPPL